LCGHATAEEYFDLVDKSGRITRADNPGVIDADLAPILLRIGTNPNACARRRHVGRPIAAQVDGHFPIGYNAIAMHIGR